MNSSEAETPREYTVRVRKMELDDIPKVLELGRQTQELQMGRSAVPFYDERALRLAVRRGTDVLLVVEADGHFAGFAIAEYNSDRQEGDIHAISIRAEYQSHGLGHKLIGMMSEEFRFLECLHVHCLVDLSHPRTAAFFTKHAFEPQGTFVCLGRPVTLPIE